MNSRPAAGRADGCLLIAVLPDHYIRKILQLLEKDDLFARKMKNREERDDHIRPRPFPGDAPELHISLFLHQREHLRDLLLKRDNLLLDGLGLQLVGFDGLKDSFERCRECSDVGGPSRIKNALAGREAGAAAEKVRAAVGAVTLAPE